MHVILGAQEATINRIVILDDPEQNVSETLPQSISQEWWLTPMFPAIQEAIGLGKNARPYIKNN
jgi:hypothetical protein